MEKKEGYVEENKGEKDVMKKSAAIKRTAFCVVKAMDLRKNATDPVDTSERVEQTWMRLNDDDSVLLYARSSRRYHVKWTVWSNDDWTALAQVCETEAHTYVATIWVSERDSGDDLTAIAKFLSNNANTLHNDYMEMVSEAKSGDDKRA